MFHSIGVDLYKGVMSTLKRDKIWSSRVLYRNYFNASTNSTNMTYINDLISLGYMEVIKPKYFSVTEQGVELLEKKWKELVIIKPKSEQGEDYLRQRINFYCMFYNYKFCEDNALHILESFHRYFLHREYVSHTTRSVINAFKNELRRNLKTKQE